MIVYQGCVHVSFHRLCYHSDSCYLACPSPLEQHFASSLHILHDELVITWLVLGLVRKASTHRLSAANAVLRKTIFLSHLFYMFVRVV